MKTKLVTLVLLSLSIASFAQDIEYPTLSVKGNAIVLQKPEMIDLSFQINSEHTDYDTCLLHLMEKVNSFKTLMNQNKFDTDLLKTKILRIEENYDWSEYGRKFIGFRGGHQLTMKLKYTNVISENLIKLLLDSKSSIYFNFSFSFSEEQKKLLKKRLMEIAVEDCQAKAIAIAEKMNYRLVKISKIEHAEPSDKYYSIDYKERFLIEEEIIPITGQESLTSRTFYGIEPEEIKLTDIIKVTWLIEKK